MNWHISRSLLTNTIFQISYMKETVHVNVKTGLPSFDLKEKSCAHSDCKIIAFTTSLQMRKLAKYDCFVMAPKLQFFTC